jgi:hypothetical protein
MTTMERSTRQNVTLFMTELLAGDSVAAKATAIKGDVLG